MEIPNSHSHPFLDIRDTPKNLYGVVSRFLHGNVERRSNAIQKILRFLPTKKSRYLAAYLDTIDNTDEERLLADLTYHTVTVGICVDLHHMGAGTCTRKYDDQVAEAVHLKKKYPGRVKVAVMLDPNRPDIYKFAKRWQHQVDAWKLYPTWYYVTDRRLRGILTDFPKPVIVHCTDTSPIHFEGSRKDLKKKLGENADKYRSLKSKAWNCQFFSHPKYIYEMSKLYPNITWICAHAGGKNAERRRYIIDRVCDNFIMDDSFTYTDEDEIQELIGLLATCGDYVLHGTDFFMTKIKTEYQRQILTYEKNVPAYLKEKQVRLFNRVFYT